MSESSLVRRGAAIPLFVALTLCATSTAHAQLNKVDQKCRSTIAKSFAKAVSSANKVSTGCHKNRNSGKIVTGTDCNDLAQADTKGKFGKAQAKLDGAIQKSCEDAGASVSLVENWPSCPEPCATSTGVPNPMTTFQNVSDCLQCLAADIVSRRNTVQLGMPASLAADKDAQKCAGAIAKNYAKHFSTLVKERQTCQKDEDKSGNNELQPCDVQDPKGKILAAQTSAAAAVADACGAPVDLNDIDSCSATDVASLNACVLAEDDARGSEAFSAGYELPATVCPIALTVRTHAGTGIGGATSVTHLDSGWNGVGHGQDLVDLYTYGVGLSCPNSSPPCGTCNITGFTDTGVQSGAFTRCTEDTTIVCDNPFGTDPDCPGLQACGFYIGPPLPLSASNTPICAVIRAEIDASGTTDVESGDASINFALRAVVYGGLNLTQPCGICVEDTTPQDGVRDGHCVGGDTNGGPCDVQGFDATFGNTSLDCQPNLGNNFSGQGLRIESAFNTGTSTLPFGTKCDFPLNLLDCACAVCSGDASVACNSNTDCSDIGAGTCTSNGGGSLRRPNGCSDLTCTDIGGEQGECQNGPDVNYCDGQKRANGSGFIACNTNADCVAVNSACTDNDCGDCTLTEPRSCFLDPIVGEGSPDPDVPVIAGTFCVPPTTSTGINVATGIPGPSRAVVQLDVRRKY
jgi:hypothetical protein